LSVWSEDALKLFKVFLSPLPLCKNSQKIIPAIGGTACLGRPAHKSLSAVSLIHCDVQSYPDFLVCPYSVSLIALKNFKLQLIHKLSYL
jgi:hypothetical protein